MFWRIFLVQLNYIAILICDFWDHVCLPVVTRLNYQQASHKTPVNDADSSSHFLPQNFLARSSIITLGPSASYTWLAPSAIWQREKRQRRPKDYQGHIMSTSDFVYFFSGIVFNDGALCMAICPFSISFGCLGPWYAYEEVIAMVRVSNAGDMTIRVMHVFSSLAHDQWMGDVRSVLYFCFSIIWRYHAMIKVKYATKSCSAIHDKA